MTHRKTLKPLTSKSGYVIQAYYSRDWNEYQIMVMKNGVSYPEMTYYTSDLQDASDTMEAMARDL